MLTVGLIGTATTLVNEHNTAKAMLSGSLPVFATPAMVALMEEASCNAINEGLDEGTTSVGISLNITHDAPTPLEREIVATATLTAIEGRKLTFELEVADEKGIIGKGTHQRFIVNSEKFLAKAQAN